MTNDDGFHSEGIIELENALREIGDVYVVAPASEMSRRIAQPDAGAPAQNQTNRRTALDG